ncbi:MAG: DUF934 domain-containing protein [Tepidamorphaceae bacterium]|nr:DUF934 domain-containing protein [Rhodobiaceae bacterium]MCC0047593.1 DUF934 domain-containing protein [Rhodobiaceae bacterium]
MTTIVRNGAFHADDLIEDYGFRWVEFEALLDGETTADDEIGVRLPNAVDPSVAIDHLLGVDAVSIPFPSFADGRGFGLARWLRRLGYEGRLRATGHLIADQYAFALRCGFDEIEISDDLAARQDESQWRAQVPLGPVRQSYQDRLRRSA